MSAAGAKLRQLPWFYWLVCLLFASDITCLLRRVAMDLEWNAVLVDAAPCAAAILLLLVLGAPRADAEVSTPRAFALGALAGVAYFFRTCGFALLDPTHIDWLLNADWAQHYSGWELFRSAPWSWPPGTTPGLLYPVGSSIVYTDSLPLLALLLKPFDAQLPHPFQYIGFWFLLSCTLQGGFGALLVRLRTREPAAILAGALFFLYAPAFIARFGHDTLTAHWLLLAGLLLYFRAPPVRGEGRPWLVLGTLASLVHPYLWFMLMALQAAYWLRRLAVDRSGSYRAALIGLFASGGIAVALWWLSGVFIIPREASAGGVPFGIFSMNLLSPIDPRGFSRFLPSFDMEAGQHEGFAYLGTGLLLLAAVAGVLALRRRTSFSVWRSHWPIIVIALLCVAFAISSVVRLGGITLVNWPIDAPWLGTFRSSGRFVWVGYYLAIAAILGTLMARTKPGVGTAFLIAALALQMWDTRPQQALRAMARTDVAPAAARLHDPRWHTLAVGRSHLTLLPPLACGRPAGTYLPFVLLAAQERLSVNTGYVARWDMQGTQHYCEKLDAQLRLGNFGSDAIFVLGPDWRDLFHRNAHDASCLTLDGYEACILPTSTGPSLNPAKS